MSQQLFGGSNTQQQNSNSSQGATGFSALPPSMQQAFEQYANQETAATANPTANTAAFTPPPLNAGATSALSNLSNSVFAPTAANINSNMASVTNPFMQDVINPTEQAAYGADSALASNAASAGQFGSNRTALGASNIANQEAATIGGLEGNQFNTSMGDVLNNILPGEQAAATGAVTAGQTQQQQSLAQSEAPYTALQAYSQLLGNVPSSGGSVASSNGQNSSSSAQGSI